MKRGAKPTVVRVVEFLQAAEDYYTANEIADQTGIKPQTVSAALVSSDLPYLPVSFRIRDTGAPTGTREFYYDGKKVLLDRSAKVVKHPAADHTASKALRTRGQAKIKDDDIAKVIHRDSDGTIVLITGSGELIKGRVMT